MIIYTSQNTAEQFKRLRKKYKITQGELAEAIDKDITTIGRWERGTVSPSHDVVVNIMNFLGTKEEVIMTTKRQAKK